MEPTRLLQNAVSGDASATDQLFQLVYGELHGRARAQRHQWNGNLTLNTTALIHEAYLKILDGHGAQPTNRAHFLALASRAMRQILLDYAKRAGSIKRGGQLQRISTEEAGDFPMIVDSDTADYLLDLETALKKLDKENSNMARVVECRFFGGMTVQETATALEVSVPTVVRRWAMARGWLYSELEEPINDVE
ncbi:MAG: RNA polymerase subunit sigma [Bacteroidetes Order II. Incertae sedis bacterium]|nr:RNA polymerase subunit sigma [Bacteroidetes Order II. bacterium]MBT4603430.1 RNA polymerase subunit sigma [Bacteroidetes Order II. bacterium]MBT5250889.1 RNA polymerase subunit sigma [Bacteroidetes Order II. bacterium]MBT6200110.1 RNA polymerase subunit sigma [Bacteroidetes Order II. bacterium]MBT6424925.1 RNA polymerase subunit sigma [Bacteroidetes Order II. bacterium]